MEGKEVRKGERLMKKSSTFIEAGKQAES